LDESSLESDKSKITTEVARHRFDSVAASGDTLDWVGSSVLGWAQ
jgi:hypothetical protein